MALSRIQTTEIADNAVTTTKVSDTTVIATDIVDGTIIDSMIASGAAIAHTKCAVGTVAGLNVGTGANQIVQLNGSGVLPALDGTQLTGIVADFNPLENQMARLGLHLGAVEQLTKFNMIDQVIDDYEDATGVDAFNGDTAVGAYQDHASTGHTITATGTAAVSTTQTKFGTHSILFGGSTSGDDYLISADHADWDLPDTGDFTIECWMYITSLPPSDDFNIVSRFSGNTSGYPWTAICKTNGALAVGKAGSTEVSTSAGVITTGSWIHVAFCKHGSTTYIYKNGVSQTSSTTDVFSATANSLYIGGGGSKSCNGYLDEIRLSSIARYPSGTTFSVATSAFTSDSNTKLLIHGEALAATPGTGSSSSVTAAGSAGAKYYSGTGSTTVAPAYFTGDQRSEVTLTSNTSIYNHIGTTAEGFQLLLDGVDNISSSYSFVFGTGTQPTSGKYLRFEFAAPAKLITEATFWHHYSGSSAGLGTWQWQGSNDGSTWTNIGNTFALTAPAAGQVLTELSGNTNYYTWYQMLGISGTISDYPYNKEIQFKRGQISSTPDDQTLISTTTTAESTVTKADIVLQTEDATGTATINTDVKAGVSRDALNYVDTTLVKIGTWGSGNVYAANDVTIPGTVMTKDVTVRSSAGGNKFHIDEVSTTVAAVEGAWVTGDQSSLITVTANGIPLGGGTFSNLVDGLGGVTGDGQTTANGFYWSAQTPASGSYIRFTFSSAKAITEARWFTQNTTYQANWKWQGSNDASTWTDLNSSTAHTGVSVSYPTASAYAINWSWANTTAYTYYQYLWVSGAYPQLWQQEVEFKYGAVAESTTYSNQQPTLTATEGYTYKFDQSDSTNSGHPLRFSTTSNGTHASGTEYTTGVTTSGTPGSAGAYTQIVVAASAPTLYYYCSNHSGMGGTANTPAEAATTSMRYKVQTKNQSASKVTRIHGTSLAWS